MGKSPPRKVDLSTMATIRVIFDGNVFVPETKPALEKGAVCEVVIKSRKPLTAEDLGIDVTKKHPTRRAGMGKHLIKFVSDDFDKPLNEDFKDYM